MKFKRFRVNKNCIYESEKQSLETKTRMACLLGYPFIRDGNNYYEISLKVFKNKPGTVEINMVEIELVTNF